ncbi:MAG: hypothetical protein HZB61_06605 [Nitrospirae bacterium]|nr:hypothetical protein [Nitrospirota bacterium]
MYGSKSKNINSFWYAIPSVAFFIFIYLFIYSVQGIINLDDSYIFYRYAENWANGYGPVFNIGEYVEGYSSLLWTVILALGSFFSFNLISLAPILNLFIGIACLFMMNYICGLVSFSKPLITRTVLLLAYILSYGVYLYGVSGMDTLLFSLVLLFSVISFYKSKSTNNYFIIIPSLFLLNVTRAEGPLYAIILLGIFIYFVFLEEKKIPKQLFAVTLIFIGLTVLVFSARYIVYKEILPATVQAKGFATYSIKKFLFTGDAKALKDFIWVISSGFKYEAPLLYLGAWIPYILLFINKDKKDSLLWLIAFLIAADAFVSIWAGGDIFLFHRHLIPILPLLLIFVGWSVDLLMCRYWKDSIRKKVALTFTLSVMIFLWIGFFLKPIELIKKHGFKQDLYLQQFGILLRNMPVQTTLLTDRAGIMPYYAGVHVYVRDLFGLMDIHNAKYGDTFCTPEAGGVCGRTDYNYSFSAPFDVFIFNAININKRFVAFCKDHPTICRKYRYFKNDDWRSNRLYVIADINHPVSKALQENFNAVPIPIDEHFNE